MPYKVLGTNISYRLIYKSAKLEITQTSINREMDKQTLVYLYNRILLSNKKKRMDLLIHGITWMNLKIIVLSKGN